MKAPIDVARHVVAHLDEDDRRTLAKELTGKDQPRNHAKKMRMCRYCGGLIHGKGVGTRCLYCCRACWTAAEGFDCKLSFEHKHSIDSFDQIHAQAERKEDQPESLSGERDNSGFTNWAKAADRNQVSDGGAAMAAMYDKLDGTTPSAPKLDLAELIQRAKEIHPLLPSIMALLTDGDTQQEAARKLRVSQSVISEAIKSLRTSCGY